MTESAALTARSHRLRPAVRLLFVVVCGLAFGFTAQIFLISLLSPTVAGTRDFGLYWATGRQLVQHADPYGPGVLAQLERAMGHPIHYRGLMRNPPWSLPLVYPLGFLGLQLASVLWTALLLACLAASIHILWTMAGRPGNRRRLLGYTFGPALICLIMGQLSILALLGLALFLRLHRTRPTCAGMALCLCLLKPQLFLTFGVVLIVWIVLNRAWRIVAGAALALAGGCALALLLAPQGWTQYGQMMRTSGIAQEFIPCLSDSLRLVVSPATAWIRFIPCALGVLFGLGYFWPRRRTWDWNREGSVLMLVSFLTAPYSWLYDTVVLLPALLQAAFATRSRTLLAAMALLSALIEMGLIGIVWKPAALYIWTLWSAPAWLVWYLAAMRSAPAQGARQTIPPLTLVE